MGNTAFLSIELFIVIVFPIFEITNQQGKKCLAFFCRNNIMHFYILRLYVTSAIIDQVLFRSPNFFQYERIIIHVFLGQSDNTESIL